MNLTRAIEVLTQFAEWRWSSDDIAEPDYLEVGQALQKVCECVPELMAALVAARHELAARIRLNHSARVAKNWPAVARADAALTKANAP